MPIITAIEYDDYGVGNSNLMAVFDRLSNNVPNPDAEDAGMTPSLPESVEGYHAANPSSSKPMNGATQQLTLKMNHALTYGMALWNSTTPYKIGSGVVHNGEWYKSLIDDNLANDPTSATNAWVISSGKNAYMYRDASNINSDGLLFFMNLLLPVGIELAFYNNALPPLQNQFGVVWVAMDEGYVVMSADSSNVGTTSGENRADTGKTTSHMVSIDETEQHFHASPWGETPLGTGDSTWNPPWGIAPAPYNNNQTGANGSDNNNAFGLTSPQIFEGEIGFEQKPLRLLMSIQNVKRILWRRVS